MKNNIKPIPKKLLKKILVVVGVLLLVGLVVFVGYFIYSYYNSLKANDELLEKAKTSVDYKYEDSSSRIALVQKESRAVGLIIYPGAFAEPEGYAAMSDRLAQKGINVFIVKSPLNFGLLNIDSASQIIKAYPDIKKWYVAGHSLGGVAACEFTKSHQASLSGLILLASYCNGNASNLGLPVLSISATNDGLTTTGDVENSKSKLPSDTTFVIINGGNHTQFGAFQKLQPGDKKAEISQNAQAEQITDAISAFIK